MSSNAICSFEDVDRRLTMSTTVDVIMPGMFAVNVAAAKSRATPSPMPSKSVSTASPLVGVPRNSSTVTGAAPSTDAWTRMKSSYSIFPPAASANLPEKTSVPEHEPLAVHVKMNGLAELNPSPPPWILAASM